MAFTTTWRNDQDYFSYRAGPAQKLISRAALVAIAFACAWILVGNLSGGGAERTLDARAPAQPLPGAPHHSALANGYARLASALKTYTQRAAAMRSEAALFDARFSLGFPPGTFSIAAAVTKGDREPMVTAALNEPEATPAATAPAPTPSLRERVTAKVQSAARALRAPLSRTASLRDDAAASNAAVEPPAHEPSIFEKLFGHSSPLTLAYAAPDDGALGLSQSAGGRFDRYTAVYDISAHTVYMPDGTTLEAHSGLGPRLDDPSHVNERMHGATPPTLYDLKLREAPFHGVQALRLIPVDEDKVFGRSGLLAHTYMLGPNGDSNGCVSFRNYNAFLRAYLNHDIKRLAVVAHL